MQSVGWVGEKIAKLFNWIKSIGGKFGKMLGSVSKFAGPLGLIISLGASIFASSITYKPYSLHSSYHLT